jgi:hypothetical protein
MQRTQWTSGAGSLSFDGPARMPLPVPGSKVSSYEGTHDSSRRQEATTGWPVCRGSAGAEHPGGGLLGGFSLDGQAPRPKTKGHPTNHQAASTKGLPRKSAEPGGNKIRKEVS